VFTADGRRVRTLARGEKPAGLHELAWDGRDDGGNAVSFGAFDSTLKVGSVTETRAMTLLK
jgi:flagellar hook assembly protein FlgD